MRVTVSVQDAVTNLFDRVNAIEEHLDNGEEEDMSLKGAHNILDSYGIPSGAIHDRVFALTKLIKER